MAESIQKTEEEIDQVLTKCTEGIENGSIYPSLSYEEGVQYALEWVIGRSNEHPFEQ